MKKADKVFLSVLMIIGLVCLTVFLPEKQAVLTRLLAHTVELEQRQAQQRFAANHLSLQRLIHREMGNPLQAPETPVQEQIVSLKETDADVAALIEKAKKKAKTTAAAGKVVERTIEDMTQQISSGAVKVQNRTDKKIDIEKILSEGANLKIRNKAQPTVLIYHSHTHESYVALDNGSYLKGETTQSSNNAENVVRVGEAICRQLENAGFGVIHDTSMHDDDYNNAYAHSGKKMDEILKKYPGIEVTIDIHRDSIGVEGDAKARTSVVRKIDGKKAAQIMIITGCEENFITGFPNWYDNLHFALGLQEQFTKDFPGLARPLYFADRKYDMYKTKNSVLIEVGSDGNTLEQAVYSGKMIGATLANYLEKYV